MFCRSPVLSLAALGTFALAVGCSGTSEESAVDPTCDGAAPYAGPGPYAAGVTTVDVGGVATEIWYPVPKAEVEGSARDVYDLRDWLELDVTIDEADAPTFQTDGYRDVSIATDAAFPIVLFSHGLGSYRSQSSFLTTHLASWGYVVAAPDHSERGIALLTAMGLPEFGDSVPTLSNVLDHLTAENGNPSSRFHQRLATDKVLVTGHSAGGSTSVDFAHDPRVAAYAPLSVATSTVLADKAALFMAGSFDEVIPPTRTRSLHRRKDRSSTYVLIFGAGHNAFADICAIARENGGLLQLARKYDVPVPEFYDFLADDGCRPRDLMVEEAWPIIRHYVTGLAQAVLKPADARPYATAEAQQCFGPVVESIETKP